MSQAIYYATNIASGANSVTVTFSEPAAYVDLRVTEYSGLNAAGAFDAGTSATGIGTIADSGPLNVTATNELLFGAGMTAGSFTGPGGRIHIAGNYLAGQRHSGGRVFGGERRLRRDGIAGCFRGLADAVGGIQGSASGTAADACFLDRPEHCRRGVAGGGASFSLQQNSNLATTNWVNVTNLHRYCW